MTIATARNEARIPANHPLRTMRRLTDAALAELDPRFSALDEGIRRPSTPPERLLRAVLLQLLYSLRSERQLVERLEFDMLFRWFVGLTIDEKVFDASTFSKNRDRLLTHEIAQEFLSSLIGLPEVKRLMSAEHFSVDGTLLKAWASMKSFRPKSQSSVEDPRNGSGAPPSPGRNGEADFRKTKRSNATHASTTDNATGWWRRPRRPWRPERPSARRRRFSASACPRAQPSGPTRATTPRPSSGSEGARDRAARGDQRDREQDRQGAQDRGSASSRGEPRLRHQPEAAQAHRGRLRLDEDSRRSHAGEGARPRQGPRRFRLRHGRLQHRPPAQAPGPEGRTVSGDMKSQRR